MAVVAVSRVAVPRVPLTRVVVVGVPRHRGVLVPLHLPCNRTPSENGSLGVPLLTFLSAKCVTELLVGLEGLLVAGTPVLGGPQHVPDALLEGTLHLFRP